MKRSDMPKRRAGMSKPPGFGVKLPPQCPHGHGRMSKPMNGDPLEPEDPYCTECGHIAGHPCEDGCNYEG